MTNKTKEFNWDNISGKQQVQIAQQEYKDMSIGDPVKIGPKNHKSTVGYVAQIEDGDKNSSGLDAYVIVPTYDQAKGNVSAGSVKNATILYQGSSGPLKKSSEKNVIPVTGEITNKTVTNKNGVKDWFNNFETGLDTLGPVSGNNTDQEKAGIKYTNSMMEKYKNANFNFFGHSQGANVGSVSVVSTKYPNRVKNAYFFEGPNGYNHLTETQKKMADKLKNRIINYVDVKDAVTIGYDLNKPNNAIGMTIIVDSKTGKNLIDQHMWGGYQYSKAGIKAINSMVSKLATKMSNLDQQYINLSRGGISSSEKIYLDADQADILANSIKSAINTWETEIKKTISTTKNDLEDNYTDLFKAARIIGIDLSEAEIRAAIDSAGGTKHYLVNSPESELAEVKTKVKSMKDTFVNIADTASKNFAQLKQADADVAKGFNK